MPTLEELRPIADALGVPHNSKTTKTDLLPAVETAIGGLEDIADAHGFDQTATVDLDQVVALVAATRHLDPDGAVPAPLPDDLDDDLDDIDPELASEVGDHVDEVDPRADTPPKPSPAPPPATDEPVAVVGGPRMMFERAEWYATAALGPAPDYAGQTAGLLLAANAAAAGYAVAPGAEPELVEELVRGDRTRLRYRIAVSA
jgi:hypothetical protein